MYISICEYQVHTYMNVYQWSMSIYLFERSMQVSGASTPYGGSSMRGYLYNVVVCVYIRPYLKYMHILFLQESMCIYYSNILANTVLRRVWIRSINAYPNTDLGTYAQIYLDSMSAYLNHMTGVCVHTFTYGDIRKNESMYSYYFYWA
jgi:hypothetical protein